MASTFTRQASVRLLNGLQTEPLFTRRLKSDYKQMKETSSKYSGVEAKGVSDIYHGNSYLNSKEDVIVLDVEAYFGSFSKTKKSDRIDMVIYDKSQQELTFVEGKHYTNSEIWANAKKGNTAMGVQQIKRYEQQISKRGGEILAAYTDYINIINSVFDQNILPPIKVNNEVILFVFGFDDKQKARLLNPNVCNTMKGVKRYIKGDTRTIVLGNLLKTAKVL